MQSPTPATPGTIPMSVPAAMPATTGPTMTHAAMPHYPHVPDAANLYMAVQQPAQQPKKSNFNFWMMLCVCGLSALFLYLIYRIKTIDAKISRIEAKQNLFDEQGMCIMLQSDDNVSFLKEKLRGSMCNCSCAKSQLQCQVKGQPQQQCQVSSSMAPQFRKDTVDRARRESVAPQPKKVRIPPNHPMAQFADLIDVIETGHPHQSTFITGINLCEYDFSGATIEELDEDKRDGEKGNEIDEIDENGEGDEDEEIDNEEMDNEETQSRELGESNEDAYIEENEGECADIEVHEGECVDIEVHEGDDAVTEVHEDVDAEAETQQKQKKKRGRPSRAAVAAMAKKN